MGQQESLNAHMPLSYLHARGQTKHTTILGIKANFCSPKQTSKSKAQKFQVSVLTCCLAPVLVVALLLGSSGCKSANTLLMGQQESAPFALGVYFPLSYL